MNRDRIERLAIDSAAGELNEDAEALFQTYLAENPQASRWAGAARRIYGKTESAIKTKTAHLSLGKEYPRIRPVLQVRWLSVIRWAAAIVFGAIVGFTAGRWEGVGRIQMVTSREPGRDIRPVETITDLKQRYKGTFWGDKMMALLEPQPGRQYHVDLRSAGSLEKYRQYIKEKNDE